MLVLCTGAAGRQCMGRDLHLRYMFQASGLRPLQLCSGQGRSGCLTLWDKLRPCLMPAQGRAGRRGREGGPAAAAARAEDAAWRRRSPRWRGRVADWWASAQRHRQVFARLPNYLFRMTCMLLCIVMVRARDMVLCSVAHGVQAPRQQLERWSMRLTSVCFPVMQANGGDELRAGPVRAGRAGAVPRGLPGQQQQRGRQRIGGRPRCGRHRSGQRPSFSGGEQRRGQGAAGPCRGRR